MKKRIVLVYFSLTLMIIALMFFVGIEFLFPYICFSIALFLILIKKYWAFYLYIVSLFLMPYLYINVGIGKNISIFDIVLAVCFIQFIFIMFKSKKRKERSLDYPFVWIALLVFSFVSFIAGITIFNNPVVYSILSFLRTILSMAVFVWAFYLAKEERMALVNIIRLSMLTSILMSSLGILALLKVEPLLKILELFRSNSFNIQSILDIGVIMPSRLAWSVPAATAQGDMLAIALILSICIYNINNINKSWRIAAVIAIVINTVALVLTFSRHSWLSAFIGIILMAFIRGKYRKRLKLKNITAALIICAALLAVFFGAQFIELQKRSDALFYEDYERRISLKVEALTYGTELRASRLMEAFEEMRKEPLAVFLGAGPGSFFIEYLKYRGIMARKLMAHDFFTAFIANWGILALALFLILYFYIFFVGYARIRKGIIVDFDYSMPLIASLSALGVIFVAMPLEHAFVTDIKMNSLMWLILGIGYGIIQRAKEMIIQK
jgi:hypothetical protein